MEHYKKIVVALDLTSHDDVIINYVDYFSKLCKAEHIYFMHVERSFYVPSDFPDDVKDAFIPMDEGEKAEIKSKVAKVLDGTIPYSIEVLEGDPTSTIAHQLEVKAADLLVMGKKSSDFSYDIVPHKLLRKSKCSVLFIPENAERSLKEIFVAVDFSNHSDESIEEVIAITKTVGDTHIEVFNAYEVPPGYYRTGKTFEEMAGILETYSKKKAEKYDKMLEGKNYDIEYKAIESHNPATNIVEQASKAKRDLIVLGSKGQTDSSSMLLGSTATKVAKEYNSAPMLIVKKKGENKSFLEVLFNNF